MEKIYIIWIWWIWISWIARYYNKKWYLVYWSDSTNSKLTEKLKDEWIDIYIWERPEFIDSSFSKIIYTEAIPQNNSELKKATKLWIKTQTYPQSLREIANSYKLIRVAWSHWKSTTTALISLIFKNSNLNINSLVWSLLKEFDEKNVFFSDSKYFCIEACEYKRSFLKYKPFIWVITNIDLDHLDYYKDLNDYKYAFEEFLNNIKPNWYAVLNWEDANSIELIWKRKDINYIIINKNNYNIIDTKNKKYTFYFPKINLNIPWEHILFDAKIAYSIRETLKIEKKSILNTLSNYNWIWRRSETIWITKNNNILMSDYWHHPTEIKLTLNAIKNKYKDKKIITVFQPHQYNRTIKLINDFKNCFLDTDILIIPDIYESRDNNDDKEKIDGKKFLDLLNHQNKIFWNWLDNTLRIILEFDKKERNLIILLMWAWDVDNLRYKIKTF